MHTFNERARDWDSDPQKVERARAAADAIREAVSLRRDMAPLEYGCGTGLLSFALQADLGEITLADSSEGMLEVLREKIAAARAKNMHPLCLDLARDPLPAERYQLTYSLMVMHHVDDTRQMLGRFHALLEPGGILCICDLDREDGSFHNYEFDGHLGFDRAELERLVREAGFEGVRFLTVFDIHRHGRTYPLFLMTARKPE